MQEYNSNEYVQEQGIMDLDSSTEQLNGPPTPAASPGPNYNEESKMSLDDPHKTRSPVGVVREITPHDGDSDTSHTEEKRVSADDCTPQFDWSDIDETMKTVVLDPLADLEVVDEGYSNWHIPDYKKLGDRVYAPEFECGGFKWFKL
jgi:hypothetical protein